MLLQTLRSGNDTEEKCDKKRSLFSFFYFHENMTQIQNTMMVTDVHADYGYINMIKKHRNKQPLEFVSRYRDPQPQVVENCSFLFNLITNIC